jgi:predicted Zn-dependent protease
MTSMRPIQAVVENALAASAVDGCVVIGTEDTAANLRWAANGLTTNGQMTSRSVTVISIVQREGGAAAGVVTRTVTDDDELHALVRASEQAAHQAPVADDAFALVEPYPHDDDWDRAPASTAIDVFTAFAPALGAAFDRMAGRDELLYGFAEHEMSCTWLATSTGLRRRFDQPDGRLELNAKSSDLTRSAWAGARSRDFTDLDVDALVADLHQRLEWAKSRIELPAGRYEVILPPTAVADLMIDAYWTASARDAEEGRNVFARRGEGIGEDAVGGTRIGEQLSDQPITLRSDPVAAGLECAPFEIAAASGGGLQSVFDNGLAVSATDWIRDGRLAELIRTRSWAARSGAQPRPGVGNLILEASAGGPRPTLAQMIAGTKRALLLTCLWYIREVDPQTLLLTGLTRDGVYLVEDGEVRGAVNNFRFNESPIDLLTRIAEVGETVPTQPREWGDYFSRTAMPALRVRDFNMSTVSPAS